MKENNRKNNKETENRILKYPDGEKPWEAVKGEDSIDQITTHIETHIGQIDMVLHELVSDTVHIDVHYVKPTNDRPLHTLITSGMSDLPMKVPQGKNLNPYMELMITLPENWHIPEQWSTNDDASIHEAWYWPIRQLKYLARFPHKYDTWLGWGHTIPNGDPPQPFAETTNFSGVIILPSVTVPERFYRLEISEDKSIDILCIVPLYAEEMDLKLNQGSSELLNRFGKNNINDIISIDRKNMAQM